MPSYRRQGLWTGVEKEVTVTLSILPERNVPFLEMEGADALRYQEKALKEAISTSKHEKDHR